MLRCGRLEWILINMRVILFEWGSFHSCGSCCGGFFDTDVGQMEEFCIIVICSSCAKGETGICLELDSLVTLNSRIVLCGYVVVLFCCIQMSCLALIS